VINFLRNIKPIKLRFYTDHASAYRYLKPDHSRNHLPDWLRKVKVYENESNVKHCYGLRESFKKGFVIPLWSDIKIETKSKPDGSMEGKMIFADNISEALDEDGGTVMHTRNKRLVKLISPWYCECDEEVTFSVFENHFSKPDRGVEFISGTLQFKYTNATHLFMYLENKTQNTLLNAGDAPFIYRQNSEREIEIDVSYDPEKTMYLQNLGGRSSFFTHKFMKRRKFGR
jgi:hypothetical protein